MLVSLSSIENGFYKWFNTEIATMSWKVVAVTPILPIFINNFKKKNEKLINLLLDENGAVDLEQLHKQYSNILNKKGSVEIMGIKFNTQDLDKLYKYIVEESKTYSAPSI